jgi:hypothetical protein
MQVLLSCAASTHNTTILLVLHPVISSMIQGGEIVKDVDNENLFQICARIL